MLSHFIRFLIYCTFSTFAIGCNHPDALGLRVSEIEEGIRYLDDSGVDAMYRLLDKTEFAIDMENIKRLESNVIPLAKGETGDLLQIGVYKHRYIIAIYCYPNKERCGYQKIVVVSGISEKSRLIGVYSWVVTDFRADTERIRKRQVAQLNGDRFACYPMSSIRLIDARRTMDSLNSVRVSKVK